MKNSIFKIAQACVVVAVLSACSSTPFDHATGTAVTAEQLTTLKPGVTTQKDVLTLLGYPSRKNTFSGKEVWFFDYSRIGALGPSENTSTILEWNEQGILTTVSKGKGPSSGNALLDAAGLI